MSVEDTTRSAPAHERESAERFDPLAEGGGLIEAEHRARYWWAAPLAAGRDVLDAGCGVGYGTRLLAERGPTRLVGVDLSSDAVERTQAELGKAAEITRADVRDLPFDDDSFDLVVCFEVIEHVHDQEEVLAEFRRVLRPDGILAISSPNRDVYTPGNPHHVHEFRPEELRGALAQSFDHVALHGQHVWLASAVTSGRDFTGGELTPGLTGSIKSLAAGAETYTLALASAAPLEDHPGVVALGDAFEVRWWHEQTEAARADAERSRQGAEHDRRKAEHLSRQVLELEQEVARVRQLEHDLELANRDLEDREDQLAAEVAFCGRVIDDMQSSLSWRITAPLRLLKRLRGR